MAELEQRYWHAFNDLALNLSAHLHERDATLAKVTQSLLCKCGVVACSCGVHCIVLCVSSLQWLDLQHTRQLDIAVNRQDA